MNREKRAWVTLGLAFSAQPRLKSRVNSAEDLVDLILATSPEQLLTDPLLLPEEGKAIFTGTFPARADEEIRASEKAGISVVTYRDPDYPEPLRRLVDPPPFLFVRGRFLATDAASVAIVGSRR